MVSRCAILTIVLVASSGLATPARAQAEFADAACLNDSCQMCAMGGTCFTNMLAQCTHPACFVGGIVGGLAGAIGGGIAGPLLLTLPGIALYPGVDPGVAFIGAIFVGAGCGCAGVGAPAMLCGELFGQSLTGGWGLWPFTPPRAASSGRMSPSHKR